MQPLKWYVERLKTMSGPEIAWRVQSIARDSVDRYRIPAGHYPKEKTLGIASWKTRFSVSPIVQKDPLFDTKENKVRVDSLIKRADQLLNHQLTFFNVEAADFGTPIDWHRDYNLGVRAPVSFSPLIDYRNAHKAGDCKWVWEINRHQHLVVLARAYKLTGDEKYAREVVAQWVSWLDANPFGYGMNWRSPMELGIRLINWIWVLDLIKDSGALSEDVRERLLHSVYLHCWDTERKYSQGSSANNHLIGEAAGVFVATAYFNNMPNGSQWCAEAKKILAEEIGKQSYDCGCTKEHTTGYPYFVIQFFIICGLVARWTNNDFDRDYWNQLDKMLAYMGRLSEGGEHIPMIGDADDGYVLDLDDGARDYRYLLAVGAVLFDRADYKQWSEEYSESAFWLLGSEGLSQYEKIDMTALVAEPLSSIAFEDAGYYLLQCGIDDTRLSVLFDCAELGYGSIAAHGHADALSIAVRAWGLDVLVDPGTYDYYTYPEWRDYFRSTRAHNTLEIDGLDQSEMQGRFLWGKRATSKLVEWQATDEQSKVVGEHDGYSRLDDPVLHRRSLVLDHAERTLTITDEIEASSSHKVALHFQLSELCELVDLGNAVCSVNLNKHRVDICFDERLLLSSLTGSDAPIGGWVSRGYHQKVPAPMIVACANVSGSTSFTTVIKFSA